MSRRGQRTTVGWIDRAQLDEPRVGARGDFGRYCAPETFAKHARAGCTHAHWIAVPQRETCMDGKGGWIIARSFMTVRPYRVESGERHLNQSPLGLGVFIRFIGVDPYARDTLWRYIKPGGRYKRQTRSTQCNREEHAQENSTPVQLEQTDGTVPSVS